MPPQGFKRGLGAVVTKQPDETPHRPTFQWADPSDVTFRRPVSAKLYIAPISWVRAPHLSAQHGEKHPAKSQRAPAAHFRASPPPQIQLRDCVRPYTTQLSSTSNHHPHRHQEHPSSPRPLHWHISSTRLGQLTRDAMATRKRKNDEELVALPSESEEEEEYVACSSFPPQAPSQMMREAAVELHAASILVPALQIPTSGLGDPRTALRHHGAENVTMLGRTS